MKHEGKESARFNTSQLANHLALELYSAKKL